MQPLPIAVCITSVPEGRVLWANHLFEEILGQPPRVDTNVQDAAWSYQLYDRTGRLYQVDQLAFCRVVSTGKPVVNDDVVVHRSDGRKVYLRTYGQPVFDSSGKLCQVSIAFVDITREVLAEQERDRAAVQLKLALEHAPIVLWAVSREGQITLAQGAGLAAIESQVGSLVGRNVFTTFEKEQAMFRSVLDRAFTGESFNTVIRVADAVFDAWVSPVFAPNGTITGARGVCHDVRELRRLEALAVQADRTRGVGVLSASVAHEINNPLTYMLPCCSYIAGALEQLSTELAQSSDEGVQKLLPLAEQISDDLTILRTGLHRIATIASDLRAFTRAGDEPPEAVDLSGVVHSVLQLIGKEVSVRTNLVLELNATAPVLGNASRLIQVVLNLVTNAMQSLGDLPRAASQLTIRTQDLDGQVVLDVADSGQGVPFEERERIFEPFVTSKRAGEGTGLGLYVSRNIVQQHGGTLTVHDSDDGGALFRLRLARYRPPSSVPERFVDTPTLETRVSVLIIDDEPDVGKALVRQLKAHGHEAQWFPNLVDAISRVPNPSFDLVFCDLMMEEIEDVPWYQYLARKWPEMALRVVFMTGGAFSPLAREFAIQNAERLVEKPFDVVDEVCRRQPSLRALAG